MTGKSLSLALDSARQVKRSKEQASKNKPYEVDQQSEEMDR
jgi:hypothetical protein